MSVTDWWVNGPMANSISTYLMNGPQVGGMELVNFLANTTVLRGKGSLEEGGGRFRVCGLRRWVVYTCLGIRVQGVEMKLKIWYIVTDFQCGMHSIALLGH